MQQRGNAGRAANWLVGLLVLGSTAASAQTNTILPQEKAAGWTLLFDGATLKGWAPEQNSRWRVSGGAIVCDFGGDGWLRSNLAYRDYQMQVYYRTIPKGKSAVYLRATAETKPGKLTGPVGGYKLQINNEDPKWPTGSIEGYLPRLAAADPVPSQWHRYDIEVRGDHITAMLDGVKVLDGRNAKFASGYFGLQHYQGAPVEFSGLKIKELPPAEPKK